MTESRRAGAGAGSAPSPDLDRMQALLERRPTLSQRHRWLYPVAVSAHRTRRRIAWLRSADRWAKDRQADVDLPVLVKEHSSLLLREVVDSQMHLQRNKVTNLRLAVQRLDGLLVRPGETFSFNRVVGNCTRRRGYVDGMRLSDGAAVAGVGGGICQLANLLHWLVLHSDLTVTERSEHSFDPFPDDGRVTPWGTGCSIVYNYVDLQVRNETKSTYQLRATVGDRYLRGQLRSDRTNETSYDVFARAERFYRLNGRYFRANEIWRAPLDSRTDERGEAELIRRNCALVAYVPHTVDVVDLAHTVDVVDLDVPAAGRQDL